MLEELITSYPRLSSRLKDTANMVTIGIARFKKMLKNNSKVTPDLIEELEEEARILDNLYEILESYPESFRLPDSFTPVAMPYIQSIVSFGGLDDLNREELYQKSGMSICYKPFIWVD